MNIDLLIMLSIIVVGVGIVALIVITDSYLKRREIDKAEKKNPNYKKIKKLKELQDKYYHDMQLCIRQIKELDNKQEIERYEQLRLDIVHKLNQIENEIIDLRNG